MRVVNRRDDAESYVMRQANLLDSDPRRPINGDDLLAMLRKP